MPQLDVTSFITQIFWLLVFYLALFFVVHFLFVPKVQAIIKHRSQKTSEIEAQISSVLKEQQSLQQSIDQLIQHTEQAMLMKQKEILAAINTEVEHKLENHRSNIAEIEKSMTKQLELEYQNAVKQLPSSVHKYSKAVIQKLVVY